MNHAFKHARWAILLVILMVLPAGLALGQGALRMAEGGRVIHLGLVARGESIDQFQAARIGAMNAARELSLKYGIEIRVDWRTPVKEDPDRQADFVDALVREREDGIMVACSDSRRLEGPINNAVNQGIPVVTFDVDSPDSRRFCNYGTDDLELGRALVANLAKVMDDRGGVAILAGNPRGPQTQLRLRGIREELARHRDMFEVAEVDHDENPDSAVRGIDDAMRRDGRRIQGWVMANSWALVAPDAMRWQPGTIKVVAADAPRAALNYVRDGYVQVLVAPDYSSWGRRSVELLVDKILFGKTPESPTIAASLQLITPQNVHLLSDMWDEWQPRNPGERRFSDQLPPPDQRIPDQRIPDQRPPDQRPPVVIAPPPDQHPPVIVVVPPDRGPRDRVDTGALIDQGQKYHRGEGVPHDNARAMEFFRRAADAGDPVGMYWVGMLYESGEGVRQDSQEAMRWFNRGSDGGNPEAMYMAGYGYENGRGVPKNMDKAIALYRKAAAGGSPEARKWMADHKMR